MKKIIEFITTIIFAALVLYCILLLGGCNVLQPQESKPILDPITPSTQVIWKTIKATDWLSSLFILAIAGGVFVGLNGLKSGWLASLAAFVGLIVKAGMSNVYVYWMCGLLLVGVVVLILLSVFVKNRAIKELVCGVERVKANCTKDNLEVIKAESVGKLINKEVSISQSKETTSLILDTKAKLKKKGKI